MTRSELVDLAWSYPFFEALDLSLAKSLSLLFPGPRFSGRGRRLHPSACLVHFEGFRCSRQPATVSPIRLGLALLHLSGHRSVI